jgi:hypothetical protein
VIPLRTLLLTFVLCAGAACYGADSDLTESGKGKPTLTVDFPETVSPGATEDLVVEVSNPGPGEMDSVFIAFTHVGVPGSGLGNPLIPFGTGGENPAIASISPEPDSVSEDGSVYRFPALAAGSSTTITFSVVVPRTRGPAANSVQVYDGSELERGTGKRVATTVQG